MDAPLIVHVFYAGWIFAGIATVMRLARHDKNYGLDWMDIITCLFAWPAILWIIRDENNDRRR
jgi:hypothetical protein